MKGLRHICLEVDDIDAALQDMQAKGASVLDKQPRIAAEGRAIFTPKGYEWGIIGVDRKAKVNAFPENECNDTKEHVYGETMYAPRPDTRCHAECARLRRVPQNRR